MLLIAIYYHVRRGKTGSREQVPRKFLRPSLSRVKETTFLKREGTTTKYTFVLLLKTCRILGLQDSLIGLYKPNLTCTTFLIYLSTECQKMPFCVVGKHVFIIDLHFEIESMTPTSNRFCTNMEGKTFALDSRNLIASESSQAVR